MTEVISGVEEPVAPTVEAQPEMENDGVSSAEPAKVDRKVYETVRGDMLKNKAEKKAALAELAEVKARLEALEAAKEQDEDDGESAPEDAVTKAKMDIIFLKETDPFVKNNFDLIYETMLEDKLTVKQAVSQIKTEMFDKMQLELSKSDPEVPPKQINPKGNSTLKEAIESDTADPRQVEAYKAQLARLGL